jgi:D-glycero-D-manno-heptose 1,7-bisphosphate phosphatase
VNRVAIFDRDGTIVDVVRDEEIGTTTVAFHPSQLRLLPRAADGMLLLEQAGFAIAIATNQPGPAKGQVSSDAVLRTNAALVALLLGHGVHVRAVETCMHHPDGGPGADLALVGPCDCRKPKPGLLTAILTRLDGDPARSWMIGDSAADLEAGRAAGVSRALVFSTNRCELCPLRSGPNSLTPDVHGPTLVDVAHGILGLRP